MTNVSKNVEKMEPLRTAGGNVKYYSHFRNSLSIPQNVKQRLPYDPAIPPPRYMAKRKVYVYTKICTGMFKVALFTIAKKLKPPKCPSTDEWINKKSGTSTR